MLLKENTQIIAYENVMVKLNVLTFADKKGVLKMIRSLIEITFLARRSFAFLLLESIMSLLTSSEKVSTYRLSRYAPNRKPAHSSQQPMGVEHTKVQQGPLHKKFVHVQAQQVRAQ
jgi:hypothetical protein